jgi:hypothetical protein
MGVDQKGKIQIFAKNIRGNANGGILEESKFTRNVAGGRQVQTGKGGGVNHDVNQSRTIVEETRVKSIECLDKLDEGSKNDESGTNKEGVLYGKVYRFKVKEFTNGEPKNPNSIRWVLKFTHPNTGVVTENILQNKDCRGAQLNLNFSAADCCGSNMEVRAFIENADSEGKLPVFMHNRFRWFDKTTYIKGLTARRDDPSKIDQQSTSLCGTAALLYFFAQQYKAEFFEHYKEFFRTGTGTINNFKLDPNPDLFEMKPIESNTDYPHYSKYSDGKPCVPHILMHITDWIVLAGTRSTDNKSYEGKNGENWDAINWCDYMVSAIRNLYGATQVEDKTSIITGFNYADTLTEIQTLYNEGWHIVLMIDSDMLDDSISYLGCITNYHWVSYEGDLVIDEKNNKYQFSYFCWHQLFKSKSFRSIVFNTNFYGYIKFKK